MKKLKKRFISAIFVCIGVLILQQASVYAAVENIRIFHDGVEVDYSKIDDGTGIYTMPQIIKDRTMVPVRQTMFYFNIDIEWDPATRMMTMRKDGSIATHELGTDVVTINGNRFVYDKTSEVVDDKTLMPNIMIAEIINCETWWEASTRTVMMRTRPKPALKPEVVSISQSKTTVAVGEELVITVNANPQTTAVNMVNTAGRILASSNQYTQNGDNRLFTLRYIPAAITFSEIQYWVEAGDGSGFNKDGAKAFMLSVNEGLTLYNVTASNLTPALGDVVRFTFTASSGVTRVRLTDKTTNKTYPEQMSANTATGTTFIIDVKMEEAGAKTFGIEIGTDTIFSGVADIVSLTVGAAPAPQTPAKPQDVLEVKNTVYDNKVVYSQGNSVKVTVQTSFSAVAVDIYDQQTRLYTTKNKTGTAKTNHQEFDLTVELTTDGVNRFTAIAYDKDGKEHKKEFIITTGVGGKLIYRITPLPDINNEGRELLIVTSNKVETIYVYDLYTSVPVQNVVPTYTTTVDGQREWKIIIPYTILYVKISAFDANGNEDVVNAHSVTTQYISEDT